MFVQGEVLNLDLFAKLGILLWIDMLHRYTRLLNVGVHRGQDNEKYTQLRAV